MEPFSAMEDLMEKLDSITARFGESAGLWASTYRSVHGRLPDESLLREKFSEKENHLCWVVVFAPPWDPNNFTPVAVFQGEDAEKRASAYKEQCSKTSGVWGMYQILFNPEAD